MNAKCETVARQQHTHTHTQAQSEQDPKIKGDKHNNKNKRKEGRGKAAQQGNTKKMVWDNGMQGGVKEAA